MPSTFETRFASEATPRLVSEFGEAIVYTPLGSAASSIDAIVDRQPAAVLSGIATDYEIEILVSRASISNAKQGDSVALKKKMSDSSNTTMSVKRVLSQHGGMWRLALS